MHRVYVGAGGTGLLGPAAGSALRLALALERMSCGNVGVIIVDEGSGEKVFPRPETEDDDENGHSSGTRLILTAPGSSKRPPGKKVV